MFGLYVDPYKGLLGIVNRAANAPILLFLCCVAACGVGFLFIRACRYQRAWPKHIVTAGAVCAALYYIVTAAWYLFTPAFLDHMEPSVAVVAKLVGQGHQAYHGLDSAERYTEMYGPLLYTLNMLFQLLPANIIFSTKLCGFCLGISSLIIAFIAFRKRGDGLLVGLQVGFLVVCCLWYGHYSYWNKAGPLVVFCSCLACWAVLFRSVSLTVVFLSVAIAGAVNAKAHSLLYMIPFIVWLWGSRGFKPVLLCGVLSNVLVFLPFIFFDVFSFQNFVQWLQIAGRHPLSVSVFLLNLKYALLLFLPVIIIVSMQMRASPDPPREKFKDMLFVTSVVFTLTVTCIVGSKIGSGPHHLLPFAPSIIFLMWRAYSASSRRPRSRSVSLGEIFLVIPLIVVWTAAAGVTAEKNQKLVIPFLVNNKGKAVVNDLRRVREHYTGMSMQMGYGDGGLEDYALTWFRPLLYESKNDYLLDAPAMMDMKMAGVALPPATLKTIKDQKYDIWLFPRGTVPFASRSLYPPHDLLFGENFTDGFFVAYQKVAVSNYFSIWMAKRLAADWPGGPCFQN